MLLAAHCLAASRQWGLSILRLRELFCGVESISWTSQDSANFIRERACWSTGLLNKELFDHLHAAGGLSRDDDVMAWLRDELLEMSQAWPSNS